MPKSKVRKSAPIAKPKPLTEDQLIKALAELRRSMSEEMQNIRDEHLMKSLEDRIATDDAINAAEADLMNDETKAQHGPSYGTRLLDDPTDIPAFLRQQKNPDARAATNAYQQADASQATPRDEFKPMNIKIEGKDQSTNNCLLIVLAIIFGVVAAASPYWFPVVIDKVAALVHPGAISAKKAVQLYGTSTIATKATDAQNVSTIPTSNRFIYCDANWSCHAEPGEGIVCACPLDPTTR